MIFVYTIIVNTTTFYFVYLLKSKIFPTIAKIKYAHHFIYSKYRLTNLHSNHIRYYSKKNGLGK